MSDDPSAEPESPRSSAIRLTDDAHVENLIVHGPVAGRDVVTITEQLTHDVGDLSANPYRGLASFTYDTRDFYGGRDQQIGEAMARLTRDEDQAVLLFVTGASGSGKSSFVQAGVVPALERWYAQQGKRTAYAVIRPGPRPLRALGRALDQLGIQDASDNADGTRRLAHLLSERTPQEQVNVLVLDQFEELFTQSVPEERAAVCAALAELREFDELKTHILITVRSDYLPTLFDVKELFEAVKRYGIELRAMNATELSQAIRKPLQEQARRDNKTKRWEPALVDKLVEDVGGNPTLLPLLQVTLTTLWDEPPHTLTLDRYRTLTDALEQQANRAYDYAADGSKRTEADQDELMSVLLDLVEVSLDDDPRRDVRRTVAKRDLIHDRPQRTRLIDELVDARLLATRTELRGDQTHELVDIIHETLLRNWPRLSEAIKTEREALQNRERLFLAVADWIEHGRSDDYLLGGVRLAQARALAQQDDIALRDPSAQALLERSDEREREEQQRELEQARALADEQRRRAEAETARAEDSARSARRLRTWLAIALTAAVVAIVGAGAAVLAFVEADRQRQLAEQQSRVNASRELGAEAQAQMAANPELSILLAREGLRLARTEQADSALRSALARSPVRLALRAPGTSFTGATFSPEGTSILTAAYDGVTRLYDADTGEQTAELKPNDQPSGQSNGLNAAALSPNGQWIAAGGADSVARVWDSRTHQLTTEFRGHSSPVRTISWSPDGSSVATGDARGVVLLWDARSGAQAAELPVHGGMITSVSFDRAGSRLLTSSVDQTARVWDVAASRSIAELRGHTGPIVSAAWDDVNNRILTASTDQTARIWNADKGALLHELRGHTGAITSASLSSDGAWVVTASLDETARSFDASTGEQTAELRGHTGRIWTAAFSPDTESIVTGGTDGLARVWDRRSGQLTAELRGHTDDVLSAAFSRDSGRVVTLSRDGSARVWEVRKGGQEWTDLRGHTSKVWGVAFSPDGQRIASAAADNSLRVWPRNGAPPSVRQFPGGLTGVAYRPDGAGLAVGLFDGSARVVDPSGAHPDVLIQGHTGGSVYSVAFSPDGTRLVSAGLDGVARVWDAATGQLQGELRGHADAVTSAVFAPDGGTIATAGDDGTARIWDSRTFGSIRELQGHTGRVHRVAFSPDGRRLVTGGADSTARVWDAATGRELIQPLRGHTGSVFSVAVSPDGRLLLTGGEDGAAVVWDATTWQSVSQLRGATQEIPWAVFSPDGQAVATASADGVARVYRRELFAPLDELLALVPARVTRQPAELSADERVKYLHEN